MLEIIQQFVGPAGVVIVIAAILLVSGIKILKEYQLSRPPIIWPMMKRRQKSL